MSAVNKMLIVIIMRRMMLIRILLVQSLYTVYFSKESTFTIIVYLFIAAIVSIDNIKQDNIFTVSIPSSLERGSKRI